MLSFSLNTAILVLACVIGIHDTTSTDFVSLLLSICFSALFLHPSEPKAVEEMKGTDQEYSSTLTQYNSSANSGGEDIELLAFQTVTGQY